MSKLRRVVMLVAVVLSGTVAAQGAAARGCQSRPEAGLRLCSRQRFVLRHDRGRRIVSALSQCCGSGPGSCRQRRRAHPGRRHATRPGCVRGHSRGVGRAEPGPVPAAALPTPNTGPAKRRSSSATATPWPTCSIPATSRCWACTRPMRPRASRSTAGCRTSWPISWSASRSPARATPRVGRRLVLRLRLPEVGLLGLQCRRRVGRLVDRSRLDSGLDPHRVGLGELHLNLWDLSKHSHVAKYWEKCRKQMLPEGVQR